MKPKSSNISQVSHRVDPEARWRRNGHTGGVIWLTGLSGSGKSTLATELELRLFRQGKNAYVLDGDNVRHGLCADLGFSPEDRAENIRRIGEIAALFAEAGFIVVTAFISPYRSDRAGARQAAGKRFHEIFLSADLETCMERDPKGLYAKAKRGEIPEFTGVSAPYERPEAPEMTIDTGTLGVAESLDRLVDYVEREFALDRG